MAAVPTHCAPTMNMICVSTRSPRRSSRLSSVLRDATATARSDSKDDPGEVTSLACVPYYAAASHGPSLTADSFFIVGITAAAIRVPSTATKPNFVKRFA